MKKEKRRKRGLPHRPLQESMCSHHGGEVPHLLCEHTLCLVVDLWDLGKGLATPCWGIRVKIRSAAVSMVLGRKYLFSLDQMDEFDKVHMRRIVGFVLAVILSGHSPNLAQPFVLGNGNKFLLYC